MRPWRPTDRSTRAAFSSSARGLALCADHPDVYDIGLTRFDRAANVAEGFVQLHRRRSERFLRRWVLPSARIYRREAGGHRRIESPWCAGVWRRMQDLRGEHLRRQVGFPAAVASS